MTNIFSKLAGFKSNTQKSVMSIYTNDEWTEKPTRETITFTLVSKNVLWIKSKQTSENSYDNIFKTFKKEIGETIRR